jgi:hypothetical protein
MPDRRANSVRPSDRHRGDEDRVGIASIKILHAFWLPDASSDFVQSGSLRLWCETSLADLDTNLNQPDQKSTRHPFQLPASD